MKDLFGTGLHFRTHGPLANAPVVEVGHGSLGGQDGQRGLSQGGPGRFNLHQVDWGAPYRPPLELQGVRRRPY